MAYVGDSDNIMKPKKGDSSINLPVTFDYSGGRKETNKSKKIWVCVLIAISLIIGIGVMTSSKGFFLFNIIFGLLIIYGTSLVIRFLIMHEHKVRERMVKMDDEDFIKSYEDLWGIYSMDDLYPYYAHLRNGKFALFIQFEKDVILGKVADSEYDHYEAIGDAYNVAGSLEIGMCHVDYMDSIGNDDRLVDCFKELSSIENPDIRDILTDVYSNLQGMMEQSVATFDVYVYTFKSSEPSFWYNIQQVISCMLEANYVSFKILDKTDLRDLSKSLFNMHDFSVVEAYSSTFEKRNYTGVVPISITKYDGTETLLNKTIEEKKEERRAKEKEVVLKKEELSNRRKKKKSKNTSEDEIDIFK